MKKFPFYKQPDQMDCGPTCLRMIAKHYGKNFSLQRLREISGINREGVSLFGISEAAEKIGFRTMGSKLTIEQLAELELPAILHWEQHHFVVLYKIKKGIYHIADPGKGLIAFTLAELQQRWLSAGGFGIALILSPTPALHTQEGDQTEALNWGYLLQYLYRYKQLVAQLFVGLAFILVNSDRKMGARWLSYYQITNVNLQIKSLTTLSRNNMP